MPQLPAAAIRLSHVRNDQVEHWTTIGKGKGVPPNTTTPVLAHTCSSRVCARACALDVLWSSRLWLFTQAWTAAAWALITIFGLDGVTGTLLLLHARLATTAVSTIPYVASAEAFPTATRSCGVGFAASFGRLGSVLAPLLVNLLPTTSTRAGTLVVISGAAALCTAALVCGLRAGVATDAKREGDRDWRSTAASA